MSYVISMLSLTVYFLLTGIAIAACRRAKKPSCDCGDGVPEDWSVTIGPPTAGCDVCGIPQRRTRLYDPGVSQIVTWDSRGEYYHFIFTADQIPAVLDRALEYLMRDDLGFAVCNMRVVARSLDLCRLNLKAKT